MPVRLYLETNPGTVSHVEVTQGVAVEARRNRLLVRAADLTVVGIFPLPGFLASELIED